MEHAHRRRTFRWSLKMTLPCQPLLSIKFATSPTVPAYLLSSAHKANQCVRISYPLYGLVFFEEVLVLKNFNEYTQRGEKLVYCLVVIEVKHNLSPSKDVQDRLTSRALSGRVAFTWEVKSNCDLRGIERKRYRKIRKF